MFRRGSITVVQPLSCVLLNAAGTKHVEAVVVAAAAAVVAMAMAMAVAVAAVVCVVCGVFVHARFGGRLTANAANLTPTSCLWCGL